MNAFLNQHLKSLKEDFKKVDYSKWERRSRSRDWPAEAPPWVVLPHVPQNTGPPREAVTGQEDSPANFPTAHKHLPTPDKPAGKSHPNTGHEESTATSMGQLSRRRKNGKIEPDPISLKKKENVKMLQFLIRSRRKAIEDLEKHCESLKDSNVSLARGIEDTERHSVTSARDLLIHHQKLESSIAAFYSWSYSQIRQAHAELRDAEDTTKTQLLGLQGQLTGVKTELQSAQAELHTLTLSHKTYKDKEYPVKALRIAELKREIQTLRETQQDEHEDVNLLCQSEMVSLQRRSQLKEQDVLSVIATQHVSYVPPVVRLMALHNSTMKKEIGIHKKEIAELEDKTKDLTQSVQELQLSRTSIRKEIFHDVFPKSDKYVKVT